MSAVIGTFRAAGDETNAFNIRQAGSESRRAVEEVVAPVVAESPTVAAAAAAAAGSAVGAEVLGRSLISRGDRIAPTDDSAFTVSVGADDVAFQVDAAGNLHAGAAAILPSEGFEWAVGDRVAMRVDQAGNAHLGDMPVVPSAGIEFATGDGRVHFSWNPITGRVFIGSLEVGEWTNAPPAGAPAGIVAFGDSMTFSQEGAGTTWPNELAALLGAPTVNHGKPAWGSANVAMLAGASSPRITVQGGQIPASGSVPVTVTPTDGWRKSGTGTLWLKVVLAGITGSLEYNLATESWAFVRDASGDATPAPPGSPVRPLGVDWSSAIGYDLIVQVGRNNAAETSAVLRDLAAFERLAVRRGVRLLTLGVSPVRGDAADLTLVTALNAQIATNASAYFDVRGWLATSSPETATSVSYATGHPQTRFYAPDGVHFNALGYKTLARGLNLHMPSIGWS